ncbi:MAG TPA: hypothetical protein VLH56_07415 [Dissulfurispiraceae bacterium]|nr:hypothetical protein [Dissulfurispiraceae bacterium]
MSTDKVVSARDDRPEWWPQCPFAGSELRLAWEYCDEMIYEAVRSNDTALDAENHVLQFENRILNDNLSRQVSALRDATVESLRQQVQAMHAEIKRIRLEHAIELASKRAEEKKAEPEIIAQEGDVV